MAKMKSAFNDVYEDKVEEVIEPIVESVEEMILEPVVEVKEEVVVEPEVVEETWPKKYICRNKCWVSTKKKLYLQGETELFQEGEFIPSHFEKL
jgi:hypothetical protein